jgi:hypothetical protein
VTIAALLVASVDGMWFVVSRAVGVRAAQPEVLRATGGATWLDLISDQAAGLGGKVVAGSPGDSMKVHGERDGTRALTEVPLLGRHMPHEHVVAGPAAALRVGAMTADAVALEARRAAQDGTEPTPGARVSGRSSVPGTRAEVLPLASAFPSGLTRPRWGSLSSG